VRYLLLTAFVVALAGCGGSDAGQATGSASNPAPKRTAKRAPVLVSGQRNGGALSATLDAFLVRTDGWTRVDKRHGGAGRRYDDFRLRADALRRLRAALARLPARPPRDSAATGRGASYLLRYRETTYYAVADKVPRALRPTIDALQAIIDGGGRGGRVSEVQQAPTAGG
jgi:hypothetical protein